MVKKYKEKDGYFMLYHIKDLDVNEVFKKFHEVNFKQILSGPEQSNDTAILFYNEDVKRNDAKENPIEKDKDLLIGRIRFIIHILAKRCSSNKYGWTNLNATKLQKTVGKDYKKILKTLEHMDVINIDNSYFEGVKSKAYQLTEDYIGKVGRGLIFHNTIKEYRDTLDELFVEEYIKFYQSLSDEDRYIYDNYNRILKNLKLKYPDEAAKYIENRLYINAYQQMYYENILDKYIQQDFKDFVINSIDKDKRIYSILSSTPKPFKDFLNIKFSIDIKNSHPLLFNYFIYQEYKFINKDIINYILNTYQYVGSSICINKINKYIGNCTNAKTDKLPNDVIKYIYSTSKGEFWEDFTELFKSDGLQRNDVKVTLFKEVFYSKSKTTRHKKFAKTFKKIYPTVYKIINQHKPNDNRTKLSHEMMKLESEIFHKILNNLYKKRGCNALSIHDAVVILNTDKTNQYTEDEIEKVMMKVYEGYNLFPTCSIDYYDPNKQMMHGDANKPHINDLFEFRDNLVLSEDKDDRELLKMINEGEVELSYSDGSIVVDGV